MSAEISEKLDLQKFKEENGPTLERIYPETHSLS